jgi:hypothetical protein
MLAEVHDRKGAGGKIARVQGSGILSEEKKKRGREKIAEI